jgi:hypothetical protein
VALDFSASSPPESPSGKIPHVSIWRLYDVQRDLFVRHTLHPIATAPSRRG